MKIIAKAVPYSSVVGGSITLHDETGAVVGQLNLRGAAWLDRTEITPLLERLTAAMNYGLGERQIRHAKRGTTYDVVASLASFQVSNETIGPKTRMVADGDPVTVYHNEHGTFVRFPDEMVSPRFEEIKS